MNKELYNQMLEVAKSRRTAKNYNPELNVDNETIKLIYEFAQTAPHSMGLELARHIVVDRESEHKGPLADTLSGFNAMKGHNGSHIGFIITKKEDFFQEGKEEISAAVRRVAEYAASSAGRELDEGVVRNSIKIVESARFGNNGHNGEEWMAKQGYIQLAYIVLAAKTLGVETTIMEGYEQATTDYLEEKGFISNEERVSMVIAFGKVDESVEGAFIGPKQLRRSFDDYFKEI